MANVNFVTKVEHVVELENREFRVVVTHLENKNKYIVGIREYIRSENYEGYSGRNGVSIPAPDLETAKMLAYSIAKAMEQTGAMYSSEE